MISNCPDSILDSLLANATNQPIEPAYTFYAADNVSSEINFQQLKEKVDRVVSGFFKIYAEPKIVF